MSTKLPAFSVFSRPRFCSGALISFILKHRNSLNPAAGSVDGGFSWTKSFPLSWHTHVIASANCASHARTKNLQLYTFVDVGNKTIARRTRPGHQLGWFLFQVWRTNFNALLASNEPYIHLNCSQFPFPKMNASRTTVLKTGTIKYVTSNVK